MKLFALIIGLFFLTNSLVIASEKDAVDEFLSLWNNCDNDKKNNIPRFNALLMLGEEENKDNISLKKTLGNVMVMDLKKTRDEENYRDKEMFFYFLDAGGVYGIEDPFECFTKDALIAMSMVVLSMKDETILYFAKDSRHYGNLVRLLTFSEKKDLKRLEEVYKKLMGVSKNSFYRDRLKPLKDTSESFKLSDAF